MTFGFSFFSKRREAEFGSLVCLQELHEHSDPGDALELVAEASARMLPPGDSLAEKFRQDPARHFGVKEARAGTTGGVRALLVWTDPSISPGTTGGVDSSSGSRTGTTFAFAELPVKVPTATLYPRPRRVPVSAGGGIGDPELDAHFLIGSEDPVHSLPGSVRSTLLATPPRTFGWFVIWEGHACAHSIDPPGADATGDALVNLVAAVAQAFR
jgi:hypothetical protein